MSRTTGSDDTARPARVTVTICCAANALRLPLQVGDVEVVIASLFGPLLDRLQGCVDVLVSGWLG